jgi:hypothetical protein
MSLGGIVVVAQELLGRPNLRLALRSDPLNLGARSSLGGVNLP